MTKAMTRAEAALAWAAEDSFLLGSVIPTGMTEELRQAQQDPWVHQCAAIGAAAYERAVKEVVYCGSRSGSIFRVAGRPPYRAMACVWSRA